MSSLAVTYRPRTLDEMVGNEAVKQSIQRFMSMPADKRPHTFLLYGPSGCGKTTLARIMAAGFGCSELDFVEFDAGKKRDVESIRTLVAESQYQPISGASRVFLFDEVHELQKLPQETLLKTTEEPSASTYFILSTTEPDKLIDTLRNRCTSFQVKRLREPEMEVLVGNALATLGCELSDEVFFAIVDNSDGAPRQALKFLEVVLTVDDPKTQLELVQSVSIETDAGKLAFLLLQSRNWVEVAHCYKNLPEVEPETLRRNLMFQYRKMILNSPQLSSLAFIGAKHLERAVFDSGESGLVTRLYAIFNEITNGVG